MTTLTKDEFKVLLMLYASSIDGSMQEDEVEVMLEKAGAETFNRMRKLFRNMSDLEVLQCINENKGKYLATDEATLELMNDIRAVVDADGRNARIEDYFVKAIKKILG
jgi:hypothetical protein